MKPSIGRIVHFVQSKPSWAGDNAGVVHLPAIIVGVWGDTCVNLQVFTDGTNSDEQNMQPVKWITSVSFDASDNPQPRTWHWPEPVSPEAQPAAGSPQPIAVPTTPAIAQPVAIAPPTNEPVSQPEATTTHNLPGYEIAGQQQEHQS